MNAELNDQGEQRKLSFPFAKRHGVLIRGVANGMADTVCRPGVTPQTLAEVRRFVGVPLKLERVSVESFDSMLRIAYEAGSGAALKMLEGLDDNTDLGPLAEGIPETSAHTENDEEAPLILLTGRTGSGKTTTLYAALERINDNTRNVMTVEDPIEYYIDGIGQTQVNTKVEMTFARGLRAILRQDPDVVMVGEIRDLETAQIAVQASLTGHLVLSTLHTNTAVGAVTRLRDMGIEPFLLSSSLIGVLAQRLVRVR